MFLQVVEPFESFLQVLFGWGVGGCGWGGIRTSFILRPCPKWYLHCFRLLYNTLHKGCGTKHVVTSVHVFGDHAYSTGFCSSFASLNKMLHKFVEQGKLSKAFMPSVTMPKTVVFTEFLLLYGLWVANSGFTPSISETERQCNKE